jgi:5-methylthioribose kinase
MHNLLDMELDERNLGGYLRERGVAPADAAIAVRELSGGVSNVVLLAEWDGGGVVVKQSLARLRVAVEWLFDRSRIFVERACLDVLSERLPGAAPRVVFADDAEYAFGMTVAPAGGEVWRDALGDGRFDASTTAHAAALLGRLQARTAGDAELAHRFDDRMPLMQGRVDPFHRFVAEVHPELAGAIGREVERLLATRSVLVHGDYSPKNLIAYADRVLLLDCEVAHWGDPAFDPAFLLCHLLLDGCHHRDARAAPNARAFWAAYREAGGCAHDEAAVVGELGCLLLARADGKSPLPGLDEATRAAVRAAGRSLLLDAERLTVPAAVDRGAELIHDLEGP